MKTITVKQMRQLEKKAEEHGTSTLELMERAGMLSAEFIKKIAEPKAGILFVCGPGNNGGDGYVCARHLVDEYSVSVLCTSEPKTDDAVVNFKRLGNGKIKIITGWPEEKPAIIVDALLGTGTAGRLREPIRSFVEKINNSGSVVISLDIPTGTDPGSGEVFDITVAPNYLLAFHAPKKGCIQEKTVVLDIGL